MSIENQQNLQKKKKGKMCRVNQEARTYTKRFNLTHTHR